MNRLRELRDALDESKERQKYCERQLDAYLRSADLSDPSQDPTREKLKVDLRKAEHDVACIQKQIDDMMD
jgi:hypothetical protein